MRTQAAFLLALPLLISCASTTNVSTASHHEYAHIQKLDVKYRDWNFPSIDTNERIQFRPDTSNGKLIMLVYFSAWCPNFRNEINTLLRLAKTHKDLEVIGISEYASLQETKSLIDAWKIPFTIVFESESRDARTQTTHYEYRTRAGDNRKWGSPWHLIIDPSTSETWVVNGELIESEINDFISQRLVR